MATKSILYCDICDKPQSEAGAILHVFFMEEGQEMCVKCATGTLYQMYGIEKAKDTLSPEVKAFDDRRSLLFQEHGVTIYTVTPKVPVERGMVIKYGKVGAEREIEILEPVMGKEGEYFAKLAG